MNAISNALMFAIPETNAESYPIKIVALFCCVGLVVSLLLAISGLDLDAGLG